MSTTPEPGMDLELHFLPAWAKQSPDVNRYAHFEGREERGGRREGGPGRGPRSDRPRREERREGGPGGERRSFGGRPGGGRPGARGGRPNRDFQREKPAPLPQVAVSFTPEEKGVESLARQIRHTGRAYPVFEIGQLILRKPDRYHATFSVVKREDGQVAQALWLCSIDDSLWLSLDEAVQHVLRRHFEMFYQAEKSPAEPPKGTYTFVAQCGYSGTVLGPPNYHDYQNKLRKLHASRFSHLPFEAYKARVKIVRDEAVVKQWVEEQSWKTEYNCLNVPDALKLPNREEAEKHFREVHAPVLLRQVESWTGSGETAQRQPCGTLRQILRAAWEEQSRFPLRLVTVLSQQFAGHGLQFFKVNKSITHVSVARPHHLELELSPVSDGVRRIVDYINAHNGCNRRQLMNALAPAPPAPKPAPPAEPAAAATGEATPPPPAPAPPAELEPTPEQTAVIGDLHWLIHQGHVIEFASGRLETAKKPKPKPVRPPAPVAPASAPAAATPPAESTAAIGEAVPEAAEHESAAVVEGPASAEAVEGAAAETAAPEPAPDIGAEPPASEPPSAAPTS